MTLTIICSPDQRDEYGHHDRAIQHAIDTIATQRGGCVHLRAGTYILRGPLRMGSNVHLEGEGPDTMLTAVPFVVSALAADADVGQKEIHPESAAGFLPGSGVVLMDRKRGSAMAKMPLTVQHVQDGVLYVRDYITNDYIACEGGVVINYFPMIHAMEVHNISISDLRIDQRRGNDAVVLERDTWGAGIYTQRVDGMRVERVTVENVYGDGLRSGHSHDVRWLSCVVRNNTHYGVHPGSHSKRIELSDSEVCGNGSDGVYLCWGVDHSLIARNHIHHNGFRIHRNGFCIGHKDTDNLIVDNHIHHNAKHGIHVRIKTRANGAHRNVFRSNHIAANGRPDAEIPAHLRTLVPLASLEGAGIYVNGITEDLRFEGNRICNEGGHQRRGIFIGADVINPVFVENEVSGHEIDVEGIALPQTASV